METPNLKHEAVTGGKTAARSMFEDTTLRCSGVTGGSALDTQVGGNHYKELGDYQPWEVLKRWMTPEEFRGYMKGTAIAYLAREGAKGGDQDVAKAAHTLDGLLELIGGGNGR